MTALTREIMTLQAEGNYVQAEELLKKLAVIRPEIQRTLARLDGIPVNIEPKFTTAGRLLASNRGR